MQIGLYMLCSPSLRRKNMVPWRRASRKGRIFNYGFHLRIVYPEYRRNAIPCRERSDSTILWFSPRSQAWLGVRSCRSPSLTSTLSLARIPGQICRGHVSQRADSTCKTTGMLSLCAMRMRNACPWKNVRGNQMRNWLLVLSAEKVAARKEPECEAVYVEVLSLTHD